MNRFHVCMLILLTQLTSAASIYEYTTSVQPVNVIGANHVAVGLHGTSLFQPNQVTVSVGNHLIFDCYEDNLWLLKATLNPSETDDMPTVLVCQKNNTIILDVIDNAPHIYYSPNVPALQRYNQDMILTLNPIFDPINQSHVSSSMTSHQPQPTRDMTTTMRSPYPTGQGTTGVSGLGAQRPFNTGRLNNTQPAHLPSVIFPSTSVSHFPVAPTHVPTLASQSSGTNTSGANRAWQVFHSWTILALVGIVLMV